MSGRVLLRLLNALLFALSGFVRRNPRKILFGAWMGHQFADNPKYLLQYLATNSPDLDLVWCGHSYPDEHIGSSVAARFVRYGSIAALKEVLTCGHCFVSHGFQDVSRFNFLRGAVITYVGHGFAIKRMGEPDAPLSSHWLSSIRRTLRRADSYTYYAASSERHREKLTREFAANNATPDRIIGTGQPRIDFLIDSVARGKSDEFRTQLLERHNLPTVSKLVGYLPTFRDSRRGSFSFSALSGEPRRTLERVLDRFDAIIVEKGHFGDPTSGMGVAPRGSTRIHSLRGEHAAMDTQELLLATDVLITDYSGCYLDFLVLERPVIHFAYDYDFYTQVDRGLYFDLCDVAEGPIIEDERELIRCLETCLQEPRAGQAQRDRVRAMMLEYERGSACDQLLQLLRSRKGG